MKGILKGSLIMFFAAVTTGVLANGYKGNLSASSDTGAYLINGNKASGGSETVTLKGSLVTFNAAYGRNFFDLNWDAIPGAAVSQFEVERSLDGIKYERIGEVKASAMGSYTFRDNFKQATARKNDFYYRLRQVDPNGNATYSKVLVARMYNSHSLYSLSVTPDPSVNDILINVQLKEKSYVVMKVTDDKGNQILHRAESVEDGYKTFQLAGTHALKPGMYSLEVIVNSNERMNMKLLKS